MSFFYEYRRFHFIPFPYSIFPPSLNQAFSFLKARTEERVTRAGIRCRISRVPGEIWLHHFYCPFPWYTVLRCPYFPFIFIFPPLLPSTLWRMSRSSHFWTYLWCFSGTYAWEAEIPFPYNGSTISTAPQWGSLQSYTSSYIILLIN